MHLWHSQRFSLPSKWKQEMINVSQCVVSTRTEIQADVNAALRENHPKIKESNYYIHVVILIKEYYANKCFINTPFHNSAEIPFVSAP